MNQAEGDGKLSPARQDWAARHLNDATRACGIGGGAGGSGWVERSQGYSHPKLVAAIKAQLDALPFCPCRYTNRAAIELARRLVELPPAPLGSEVRGMGLYLGAEIGRRG